MFKKNSHFTLYLIIVSIYCVIVNLICLSLYFKYDLKNFYLFILLSVLFLALLSFIYFKLLIYYRKKDSQKLLEKYKKYVTRFSSEQDLIDKLIDLYTLEQTRNQKLTILVNSLKQGLILFNEHGKVVLVNPAALKVFKDCKLGYYIYNFVLNPDIIEAVLNIQKNGGTYDISKYEVDKRIYQINIYDIEKITKDSLYLVAFFIEDITPRLELETIKRDFFANASHELKSPLTSIIGYTELLQGDFIKSKKEKTNTLDRILFESNRMSNIVKQMLSLSKYEFSSKPERLEDISLKKVLIQVLEEMQIQINNKKIKVSVSGDDIILHINNDDLIFLIKNLVENAIKYNKEKGKIFIVISNEEKTFEISDTGIGIPEQDLGRIFERFYQVDRGKSNKKMGTGLGLAIVKHVLQNYNYKIEVKSVIDKGTTFKIFFNK